MSGPQPDLDAVVADLRSVAADLDGHIERRAAELATPIVRAALANATAKCRAAAFAVQRRDDLVAELIRRLNVAERRGGNEDG